jgi:hypothetical protein
MKVQFKNLIAGFTGKVDGSVVYLHKECGRYIVRRLPRFTPQQQNHDISNVSHNLFNIHPSAAYRNDLRAYITAYKVSRIKNKQTFISWSNAYYSMLYEMQRQNPGQIDLKTLTREQIYAQDLPCKNVASAVAAGLLPQVKDWETLTSLL